MAPQGAVAVRSGRLDLNAVLAAGVPCALGINEAGINDDRDMLQEMRLADAPPPARPGPPARWRPRSCGWPRSKARTTPFAGRSGRFASGMLGDVVVLDRVAVTHPWQEPSMSLEKVLLRRVWAGETVMTGGEIVLNVGRLARLGRAAWR